MNLIYTPLFLLGFFITIINLTIYFLGSSFDFLGIKIICVSLIIFVLTKKLKL